MLILRPKKTREALGRYDVLSPRLCECAGMAKLADAADLKSADQKWLWGFKSPSRHHVTFKSRIFTLEGESSTGMVGLFSVLGIRP